MFENPTLSVGMIGWFIRSAVDLTWTIEYAVQAGRARIVSFIWLLPLTGIRATESGVDRRVLGVVTVVSTLVSVALGLAVAISGFRSARFACIVIATGQPAIFASIEAGYKRRERCHGLRLFLAEVSGEPFVADAVLKGR